MNIFGKLPLSRKSGRKKEKSVVWFTYEQNVICSQTQSQTPLGNIAHEQTIICRQLFAGDVVGFRPMTLRILDVTRGAYHLTENVGNSGWKVNGKVTFRKFQPKIEEYVLR